MYDTVEHPALGQSPRDAFATGLFNTGGRSHLLIPYDNDFRMLTLPTTAKGTAKVQPGRGIKINNRYFWSEVFYNPRIEGTRVPVRYDPFNAGKSYAYALSQWVECHSEYYKSFLNGAIVVRYLYYQTDYNKEKAVLLRQVIREAIEQIAASGLYVSDGRVKAYVRQHLPGPGKESLFQQALREVKAGMGILK